MTEPGADWVAAELYVKMMAQRDEATTGKGDPFADIIRKIDAVLEEDS